MVIERYKVPGLACHAYLIADEESREAMILDPQRDADVYLEPLDRRGLRLKYIVDTHLHADHVSGTRELSALTGAPVYLHVNAEPAFEALQLRSGDRLTLGRHAFEVLFTPGHTPESVCLYHADAPRLLFTGDTLFVGDVGRPDLLGEGPEVERRLAGQLYHSLFDCLLKLPDDVEVYPGHGEGSLCGTRSIGGGRETTTIGAERTANLILRPRPEGEFVDWLLGSLPTQPANFAAIKRLNRQGPPPRPTHLAQLTLDRVQALSTGGTPIVDARQVSQFGRSHIPGAINVPLSSDEFAPRAAWVVPADRPFVLVLAEAAQADTALRALSRVGLDSVSGYFVFDLEAWAANGGQLEPLARMELDEAAEKLRTGQIGLIDVRQPSEWEMGHAEGAVHIPLPELADRTTELDPAREYGVVCAGGERSSIAASYLAAHGFRAANVVDGMDRWLQEIG